MIKKIDQGGASDDILLASTECMNFLFESKVAETRDIMQKAKIKWAVEGDKNSKFSHGMVNRKRTNLAVKGIMIDGVWVDEPRRVKNEFRDYFATRFQDPGICQSKINFYFLNDFVLSRQLTWSSLLREMKFRMPFGVVGRINLPGLMDSLLSFFVSF